MRRVVDTHALAMERNSVLQTAPFLDICLAAKIERDVQVTVNVSCALFNCPAFGE